MTYREMMLRYAALRNLKRRVVVVPFFTPRLSSYWVHLVTPVPARLAQPLILGLRNEVVVRDDAASATFPQSCRWALTRRCCARSTGIVPPVPRPRGSMRSTCASCAEFFGVREGC